MKILLIDDDAAEYKFYFSVLGAEMFYALDSREAEAILAEQSIDIILMDGSIPTMDGAENGPEIVKHFRASGIASKIVMFSSDDDKNAEGIRAGADGVWKKKELRKEAWKESFLALCKNLLC